MSMRRITVTIFILLLLTFTFVSSYTKADFVYADSTTDNWQNVTTNEQLVEAFRYYCKSRDLTIEGSAADVITTFTTQTFNNICNGIGIDVTAIQAHLKYATDQNGNVKYLWDSTGITAYNQIFAQFLQDNNLEVGDSANQNDNTLYDGYMFTDDDGNRSLIWILNSTPQGSNSSDTYYKNAVAQKGTYLKYKPSDIYNAVQLSNPSTLTINANSNTYSFNAYLVNGVVSQINTYQYIGRVFYAVGANDLSNGYTNINGEGGPIAYCLASDTTRIRIGVSQFAKLQRNGSDWYTYYLGYLESRNITNNYPQAVVYLTTNNTVINNNNYEGDTIINPDGQPSTPGGDNPSYDPYPGGGGTTTDPDNTGGGSGEDDNVITFPDFDFHFPEIDWSIGDLSEKFPFSIPFDLIAFFTVMNAEPQAPAIDANIPLGSWYTWHFQADFSQFDNYAVIIRNVEFIAFCVGLIYLTIKLVKG